MEFIVDNSSSGTNSNIITGLSDNIVYNSTLLSSSNNLQSNILNTSNYSFNISNILTARDALNLSASSNYASNISNILKANIDANNTAINTAIGNTSNYASNISNILLTSISLGTNTSNYASNISNILNSFINTTNTNLTNRILKTGDTMTGNLILPNLYLTNPIGDTSSIYFSPTPSIYSIFSRKVPWAMYFAEDYNSSSPTILPNYLNDGTRNAILSGTSVTKSTVAGNGAAGAITFISGTTGSIITFPTGSIPTDFTILGLMRHTNPTSNQNRILTSSSGNWLLGYNTPTEGNGIAFFEGWKTATNEILINKTDWLCMIAKNGGAIPNNIIANGIMRGTATGGTGGGSYRLSINNDTYGSITKSEWALSCVMIWESHLTDSEMVDLNTIINNYKNDGASIKLLINSTNDDESIIESRVYSGTERTELLLFKGNDATGTNAPDRIRLKSGNIAFDTYNATTSGLIRNNENIVMLINENGNVGIGTTTNLTNRLNINGTCSATTFSGSGASLTGVQYSNITGLPTTFSPTMTNIYSITETNTLITNTSNYASNISNVLKANIDANNTATNTAIGNTSNYASNISNILLTSISLGTNTSNYSLNISNIIIANNSNFTLGIATNTSNYALNISNIIATDYLLKSGGTITGNLGIGTNPSQKLHIDTGCLHITGNINNPGNNTSASLWNQSGIGPTFSGFQFVVQTNGTTERMRIDSSGNLGIGTNNPQNILQIGSGNRLRISNGTNDYSVIGVSDAGGVNNSAIVLSGHLRSVQAGNIEYSGVNNHIFYTTSTGSYVERMRIDSSGNVGIGINPPEVKLDVNGSLLVRTAAQNSGGTSGIFFRNGYTTVNHYNCSILTYDHNADGWSDGLSINGWDGLSFCTGSNLRNETMRISSNGHVGIGTINPTNILQVGDGGRLRIANNESNYTIIGTRNIDDNLLNTKIFLNGNTCTYAGAPGFIQYWSTGTGGHVFYNGITERMRITNAGNVGIGTNDPLTLLHVVGKTLIHNGLGAVPTNGTYGNDGTRLILWPGAVNNTPYSLGISATTLWYTVPTGAIHAFYVGTTERMRINDAGNIITSGNIDCGGGIAIFGSTAFFNPDNNIDSGNLTNTYINFKNAGANTDWCYLRQIGGTNAYKLAFDFHDDDNDARFCIRRIQSTLNPDSNKEVFTVDNGNITCTGNINMGTDNLYPDIRLGSANGNNLAIATPGGFSLSASSGDMVLRSLNRLILQSGGGNYGILIDTNNNVSCNSNFICNGNLGVSSATATNGIDLGFEKYLRIAGSSTNNNTKALSIGGFGLFEMDAPGVVGGRFKIDNDGNVTCKGTITAATFSGSGSLLTNVPYSSLTGTSPFYTQSETNTLIFNTSNYASNISNILTARDATNLSSSSNYALNISNIIIANNSNFTLGTATNTSNYALNISNIIIANNSNFTLGTATNTSNYALNISNIIIANNSNFTLGTATNTSNYALNISNIIIANNSNFTLGTATNTSNYALNISNIIIANNSNFTLGTATNTSNYASNISNIIIANNSNFTLGIATNTSNYASNISNIIIANNSNFTLGIATNTSNYASNISNIIISRYLPLTAGTLTGTLTAPTINLTTSADGNNPLFIRSAQSGANNCIQIQNNINQNAFIGLGGSTFGSNYGGNLFFESASGSIILNTNGRTSASTPNMIIHSTGNVGIGTTVPNGTLELYSTTQLTSRIILSGKEFFESATAIASGGIAFLCGVNRTDNRQLWIGDSTKLTQNATNPVLRINIGGSTVAIDCLGTIGTAVLPITFGNSSAITTIRGSTINLIDNTTINGTLSASTINTTGNVGIGTTNSRTRLHIDHSSTTFNAINGGLYLINSNNVANNCSVIGASIYGSTANKAGLSLNVNGNYGWSMYINGSDTTNKTLRFNSSDDSSGIERLQIRGSDGYTIFTGNMHIGSSTGSGSLIIGNSASATSITLTDISTAVWKIETGNYNLTFSNDSPTPGTFQSKIIITSNANLLVRGDISAFANMSDRRLKHNINDLSINCIDLLNNIKPVEFIWNDMDEIINLKRNTLDHGFIAQDIELLLPNLVNQYEKYKSIKYEKFTPYLVKGSQELYKLIQEQQKKIIDLQEQINMIKSQLS